MSQFKTLIIKKYSDPVKLDSFEFANTNDMMVLYAAVDATNTHPNCTARNGEDSAGYQVPMGKKLIVLAARTTVTNPDPTSYIELLHSDNDVGFLTATPFVADVHKASDAQGLAGLIAQCDARGKVESEAFTFVPEGKFVGIQALGGNGLALQASVKIYCYLTNA
jgi:hypothetical protein